MVDSAMYELRELRQRIDEQLLGYLNAEDGRGKLRAKLQDNMRKYLSIAPHNSKFHFPETSVVLRRSITASVTFSGERAASAWAALAKYAENLVRHPWRKEFREVKLYCGFYKHEVESRLVGAETMLEAMGYVHVDRSVMMLDEPFDGDRVTFVAKDAMMAEVECRIMQQVWDKVSRFDVSWAEILDFREQFNLTPEHLAKTIVYQVHSRRFYDNQAHQSRASYPAHYESRHIPQTHHHVTHQPTHYPGYSAMLPPSSYHCPVYNYSPVVAPPVLKPNDLYPSNGQLLHMRAPCHPSYNGYSQAYPSSFPATVPTGQLIELNTSPVHHFYHPPQYYPAEPIRTTEIPSSRAKDDGAGSWENWDDVYQKARGNRNSDKEISECVKALSLNRAVTPPPLTDRYQARTRTDGDGASRHRISKNSIDLEDVILPKARLNKNSSESEAESSRSRSKRISDLPKPRKPEPEQNVYENDKDLREKEKFVDANEDKYNVAKPEPKVADLRPVRHVVTLDVSPKFSELSEDTSKSPSEKNWECHQCTFHNPAGKNICGMCNKSRCVADIPPQPCGGPQCPHCTLVNERGKNFCSACGNSLKDSPTYI